MLPWSPSCSRLWYMHAFGTEKIKFASRHTLVSSAQDRLTGRLIAKTAWGHIHLIQGLSFFLPSFSLVSYIAIAPFFLFFLYSFLPSFFPPCFLSFFFLPFFFSSFLFFFFSPLSFFPNSLHLFLSFSLPSFLSFFLSIFLPFFLPFFLSFYLPFFLSFFLSCFPSSSLPSEADEEIEKQEILVCLAFVIPFFQSVLFNRSGAGNKRW